MVLGRIVAPLAVIANQLQGICNRITGVEDAVWETIHRQGSMETAFNMIVDSFKTAIGQLKESKQKHDDALRRKQDELRRQHEHQTSLRQQESMIAQQQNRLAAAQRQEEQKAMMASAASHGVDQQELTRSFREQQQQANQQPTQQEVELANLRARIRKYEN